MKTKRPAAIPLVALAAIESANAAYRKSRVHGVVFVIGVAAAILSSVLHCPFRLPLASSVAFAVWVLALIVYSEAHLGLTQGAGETLGRLKDEKKAMKCLVLFLLPMGLRVLRVIVILSFK